MRSSRNAGRGRASMSVVTDLLGAAPWCASMLASQYWGDERWGRYTRERLRETLAAAARIPYYTAHFGGAPAPEDLSRVPLLPRGAIPALHRSVRALHRADARLLSDRSSGSTGMPVEFLFDAAHQRSRFAARARYLLANGWSPTRRNAWIIYLPEGTPDGALVRSRAFMRTRFLSVFTPLAEQVEWLQRLDPFQVYTLPSNLDALLDILRARGVRLPSLRRLFCGGEVVDDELREGARAVLGVEIADNYGSTEACIAWQCPAGAYHVNAEHVLVEIVDDGGRPAAPGEMGKVVLTTLRNRVMPLVRYEIGDRAQAARGACLCGRTLPLLGRVFGRSINLFRLADGRLISPWEMVVRLKYQPELRQFQIVQRALDRFALRFVADSDLSPDHRETLRRALVDVVGSSATVELERVDGIARTPTGKFMTAVSEIAAER